MKKGAVKTVRHGDLWTEESDIKLDLELEKINCPECYSYDKIPIGINGHKVLKRPVSDGCMRTKVEVTRRFTCGNCGCKYDFVRFERGKLRGRDLAIVIFLSLFLVFGAIFIVSLVAEMKVLAVVSAAISCICLWIGAALCEDKLV